MGGKKNTAHKLKAKASTARGNTMDSTRNTAHKLKAKASANDAAEPSSIKPNDTVSTYNVSRSHTVYDNTFEEFILINVSKAILIYRDHVHNRTDLSTIFSWSGFALSCFIALVSIDFERIKAFHEFLFIALILFFLLGFIFSLAVASKHIRCYFQTKGKYTEETFIAELKSKKITADTVDIDNESQLPELTSIQKNK